MLTLTELAEINLGLLISGVVAFSAAWIFLWLFFRGIEKQTSQYRAGELAIVRRRESVSPPKKEDREIRNLKR